MITSLTLTPDNIEGLTSEEKVKLKELIYVFNNHVSKNFEKDKYYEGHITLE